MCQSQVLNVLLCLTREECDRLTSIINSRVVERPSIRGSSEGKLSEPPNKTVFYGMGFKKFSKEMIREMNFYLVAAEYAS